MGTALGGWLAESSTAFTTGVVLGATVITKEAWPLGAVAGTGATVIENADCFVESAEATLGEVVSMDTLGLVEPAQ